MVVQSMTNTDTEDPKATALQVNELARTGSELVRITGNTAEAAKQADVIREFLDKMGCFVPLVGNFHFNGDKLLSQYPDYAEALAAYRIIPGNVGAGVKQDARFSPMIEMACRYEKPARIGVNGGSLDPELLAKMMDQNARLSKPLDADTIQHGMLILSALSRRACCRTGPVPRHDCAYLQSERCPGPDQGLQ